MNNNHFCTFFFVGGFFYINNDPIINTNKNYWVSVKGAVYHQSRFKVKRDTKLNQVIYRAHLLISADISQINMDKRIEFDQDIYIPFKKGLAPKIDSRDGLSKIQISNLGVNQNLAKALYDLFIRKHNYVTWEEIDQLPGTGQVTMAKLKSLLIIAN